MTEKNENNLERLVLSLWNVWRTFWWWLFVIVVIFFISRLLCL